MSERLTIDNLGKLAGGRAGLAVNSVLAQILADVDERGDDMKERKATITVGIGRVAEGSPHVYIDVRTKTTMPSLDSGSTIAELIHNGRTIEAHWQPDSPERPDQPSIPYPPPRHPEAPEPEED